MGQQAGKQSLLTSACRLSPIIKMVSWVQTSELYKLNILLDFPTVNFGVKFILVILVLRLLRFNFPATPLVCT